MTSAPYSVIHNEQNTSLENSEWPCEAKFLGDQSAAREHQKAHRSGWAILLLQCSGAQTVAGWAGAGSGCGAGAGAADSPGMSS